MPSRHNPAITAAHATLSAHGYTPRTFAAALECGDPIPGDVLAAALLLPETRRSARRLTLIAENPATTADGITTLVTALFDTHADGTPPPGWAVMDTLTDPFGEYTNFLPALAGHRHLTDRARRLLLVGVPGSATHLLHGRDLPPDLDVYLIDAAMSDVALLNLYAATRGGYQHGIIQWLYPAALLVPRDGPNRYLNWLITSDDVAARRTALIAREPHLVIDLIYQLLTSYCTDRDAHQLLGLLADPAGPLWHLLTPEEQSSVIVALATI